ncbi:aspartyl-tRNA(Asn)/glutamyl-tRNA(Gln) amidotransferase subunit B [Caldanaerobacter subterraneus subsp. tengcongensis MB4]|jgi:aspartyl-tRNA(Asn)/glutamyl-tRNA(Gln) amidotransferase subunit B|uniref:Aspartyl/glutamyl-tRNA(Asn/Gln) amidotransferase subunit B n=3 Tax=Caldanaerobacter subterraneus TaxID=911092 RepID=GATB_CALS4|nr:MULTISPECIES: Asp-tRNA(Asn)/Glu-tRNA(Gln) amidotransferase subunit GatB [Caldanaerobacter]Q8RC39.1 RecName: Full=Aspartyl/glutamyl-tRNA(Asn/Gln) amidotransferase subunit B; Short=Asp/Glu-ADT subunit B [Caldanaerobacter subterraneus subsp. tengcongensis MB4]AAM23878.1 Asp-tRNAAsn/Glu-tRNAGln amidotransferase B subunit (PET112 homolog) [Caldanaerobacter subterraneus subsp. tengcongensis MB4]ERM92734.1 aspartyl/glutamyl-tRNA amidotransferase subunit B [Caldanaerobacter subterraneus subsp. yonsei
MKYEAVIGLEVHAELLTDSKIFCGCSTKFGSEPNTQVCPVCLGLPGTLPVLNKKVVEYAVRAGLALNCTIANFSKMDRKNYFYPDLPKAYQISQYDLPLCSNGYIEIEVEGGTKRIGIKRIHIEEDAGKLLHEGTDGSLVDYNRAGVPLIEIVSEPDISTPEEAYQYLVKLKSILEYTEVSDCKMQEGSLRVDTNVSVRPVGTTELGTKIELKNLNSFKAVQKALEYEIKRQIKVLEEGGTIVQETRRWNEAKGITEPMRTKEEAHDYRYFPEPDLVPIIVTEEWKEEIRKTLPEMPDAKRERFITQYGLPEYDAKVITSSKKMADFFEKCASNYHSPKIVSNWLMGEFARLLNDTGKEIDEVPITPDMLIELLKLVDDNVISGSIAKTVFEEMFFTGKNPQIIVEEKGLRQIADEGELRRIVRKVIEENPKSVEDYKKGKEKALGFLVGQVMKETKGKANPQLTNQLLREELSK